jgi:hypothetical protein
MFPERQSLLGFLEIAPDGADAGSPIHRWAAQPGRSGRCLPLRVVRVRPQLKCETMQTNIGALRENLL